MHPPCTRRHFVLAMGSAMLSLAGCNGRGRSDSGPQEREYTLTITTEGDTIHLQIEPAGEVEDVIQVNVGDTVTFTVVNNTAAPIGFHNHATDAEIILEPGEERVMTFEATDAMTGRQEIEGWVADSNDEVSDGDHGGDASTLAIIEVRPRGS